MPSTMFDVTIPISDRLPVWPGDPPVSVVAVGASGGMEPRISHIQLSSHAGTHVDPPAHFVRGGVTVDRLPLDLLIGPAWVIHVPGRQRLTGADLAAASVPAGVERLLIRTDNSTRATASLFSGMDFAALAENAAPWLLQRGVRLVGIDGPSIEAAAATEAPVHLALLAAGVVIVEGLALYGVVPGLYQMICLPLLIEGGDGAPARVVLVRND